MTEELNTRTLNPQKSGTTVLLCRAGVSGGPSTATGEGAGRGSHQNPRQKHSCRRQQGCSQPAAPWQQKLETSAPRPCPPPGFPTSPNRCRRARDLGSQGSKQMERVESHLERQTETSSTGTKQYSCCISTYTLVYVKKCPHALKSWETLSHLPNPGQPWSAAW